MNFWTIYFVMKADSIECALWWVFAVSALVVGGTCISLMVNAGLSPTFSEKAKKLLKKAAWYPLPLMLIALAMPSTKTLATALIVPAIVNNETLQKEAGELYNFAKSGLKSALTPDDKTEEPKEVEAPVEEL